MPRLTKIKTQDPSCVLDPTKKLIDPWGDCHALVGLTHLLNEPVACGPSPWVDAANIIGRNSVLMAMEEIRNSGSLDQYNNSKQVTWWKARHFSSEKLLDLMIRHTVLCGGKPEKRQIWIKRWTERKEQRRDELLSRKNCVVLVNLDVEPRLEKKEWIQKILLESTQPQIIAYGLRRNHGIFKKMNFHAICPTPKQLQLYSNKVIHHQPYLISP